MTIRELLESANEQSDENYDIDTLADMFNDAIASINVDFPAMFMSIDPDKQLDDKYPIHNESLVTHHQRQDMVSETFLRNLVKPFIIYQVKIKEDELDTAGQYYALYSRNLSNFKRTMRHMIDRAFVVEIDGDLYDLSSSHKDGKNVDPEYSYPSRDWWGDN